MPRPAARRLTSSICTLAAFLVAGIALLSSPAAAVTIYDSTSLSSTFPPVTSSATNWFATGIQTNNSQYVLQSVVIKANAQVPLVGTPTLSLFAGNASAPSGAALKGTFTLVGTWSTGGNNTFTASGQDWLNANTDYWFALGSDGGWAWNATAATGVAAPATPRWATSSNGGSSWTAAVSARGGLMAVNAIAVPEPSTWAMGIAGLGFVALNTFRRRRQG